MGSGVIDILHCHTAIKDIELTVLGTKLFHGALCVAEHEP